MLMFMLEYSALSESKEVILPAPAIIGKASGTIDAPVASLSSDLKSSIPRIISKAKNSKIREPAMAKDAGIKGKVYVTFVVDKDGSIADVKVLRGIGGGCDEEAMRVVKGMPRWSPGKQRGKAVRVQYNLPINFILK